MAQPRDGFASVRDADPAGEDLPVGVCGRAGRSDREEDSFARRARLRPDARAMVRHRPTRHLR